MVTVNLQQLFADYYNQHPELNVNPNLSENTPLADLLNILNDGDTQNKLALHKPFSQIIAIFYPMSCWGDAVIDTTNKPYKTALEACWEKSGTGAHDSAQTAVHTSCNNTLHAQGSGKDSRSMSTLTNMITELPTNATVRDYREKLANYPDWGRNIKDGSASKWKTLSKRRETLLVNLLQKAPVPALTIPSPSQDQTKDVSIDIAQYSQNIIFYGPPGTGKTRKAKIMAARIMMGAEAESKLDAELLKDAETEIKKGNGQIRLVQFHPSYSYFDFVEGIGVGEDGFKPQTKIFRTLCETAASNKTKPYILIVDEINRADVSSVLGELLYGLEYRSEQIATSVMKEPLTVPEMLYLIGTMNTADQSIAGMDYAVRRRFAFEYVPVNEKPTLGNKESFHKMLFDIVRGHIQESVARGVQPEDIMPGTSFFITKKGDVAHQTYKIRYELIPLLKEYAKNGLLAKRKIIKLEAKSGKSLCQYLMTGEYEEYLLSCITHESSPQKG